MRFLKLGAACLIAAFSTGVAFAQTLLIEQSEGSLSYSISQLKKEFAPAKIKTVSTWTNGEIVTYQGIKLSALLDKHDIHSEFVTVAAENGYESTVPIKMVEKYQPILAFVADGAPLVANLQKRL